MWLWIAFKLVSLQLQTQLQEENALASAVVNCFQISIFAVANTTSSSLIFFSILLWIAFKLVSLQLQTQHYLMRVFRHGVVNCFQISIFAVANTTARHEHCSSLLLWIAFKLVSLQLQTQQQECRQILGLVVNCFQISIFAVANTTLCLFNIKLI